MLLAMLLTVSMHACAKKLSEDYSIIQVVWARYLVHLIIMLVLLGPRVPTVLGSRRAGLQCIRAALILSMTLLYVLGIASIPMADANAVLMTAPLLVTALSVPLLGERVGTTQWAAVCLGCLGTLLIIRPGPSVARSAALLPLLAASCFALFQICTRILSRVDSSRTTLLYTALVGSVLMTAVVPLWWRMPAPEDWLLFVLLGVLGGGTHFAMIRALAFTPASRLAPFTYSQMIWSGLVGYVVFAEIPDAWTFIGGSIVAACGLLAARSACPQTQRGPEGPH